MTTDDSRTPISLDEHQSILLTMLTEFDNYCKEKRLVYWLSGGTLLGCVRHGGFIPWDDDIDVIMPRADYEKFVSNRTVSGLYPIVVNKYGDSFRSAYANLVDTGTIMLENDEMRSNGRGVFLDVFPLDGLPDGKRMSSFMQKQLMMNKVLSLTNMKRPRIHSAKDALKVFAWAISKALINPGKLVETISSNAASHSYEDSAYVGVSSFVVGKHPGRFIWEKKWFEGTQSGLFEGHEFDIPAGYHELLRTLYGEYMTLPPVDQRLGGHAQFARL